jgi:hypothetical protein
MLGKVVVANTNHTDDAGSLLDMALCHSKGGKASVTRRQETVHMFPQEMIRSSTTVLDVTRIARRLTLIA